jgi:hypothetical protein
MKWNHIGNDSDNNSDNNSDNHSDKHSDNDMIVTIEGNASIKSQIYEHWIQIEINKSIERICSPENFNSSI